LVKVKDVECKKTNVKPRLTVSVVCDNVTVILCEQFRLYQKSVNLVVCLQMNGNLRRCLICETKCTALLNLPYAAEPTGFMENAPFIIHWKWKKERVRNCPFFPIKKMDHSQKNTSIMELHLFIYLHHRKRNSCLETCWLSYASVPFRNVVRFIQRTTCL
jgi:hypothetical protein